MKLDAVVPLVRSYEEYLKMLGLSFQYLDGKILDCAAGPASFNANAALKGYRVTSCELLCRFTAEKPPTASARLTVR